MKRLHSGFLKLFFLRKHGAPWKLSWGSSLRISVTVNNIFLAHAGDAYESLVIWISEFQIAWLCFQSKANDVGILYWLVLCFEFCTQLGLCPICCSFQFLRDLLPYWHAKASYENTTQNSLDVIVSSSFLCCVVAFFHSVHDYSRVQVSITKTSQKSILMQPPLHSHQDFFL